MTATVLLTTVKSNPKQKEEKLLISRSLCIHVSMPRVELGHGQETNFLVHLQYREVLAIFKAKFCVALTKASWEILMVSTYKMKSVYTWATS